jgi:hypothetical protein
MISALGEDLLDPILLAKVFIFRMYSTVTPSSAAIFSA